MDGARSELQRYGLYNHTYPIRRLVRANFAEGQKGWTEKYEPPAHTLLVSARLDPLPSYSGPTEVHKDRVGRKSSFPAIAIPPFLNASCTSKPEVSGRPPQKAVMTLSTRHRMHSQYPQTRIAKRAVSNGDLILLPLSPTKKTCYAREFAQSDLISRFRQDPSVRSSHLRPG